MSYTHPNLLADSAGDFEGGTSTWIAGANTTRTVTLTENLTGARSMRLTPTAAGQVTAVTPRISVSESTPYLAYVPVRTSAATAGRTAAAKITWYDALVGGSSLGTSTSTINLSAATGWPTENRPVATGTAPTGTLAATLALTVTGLAAGEFVNADFVYMGEAAMLPGNLLTYATQSVESDTSGWAVSGATKERAYGSLVAGGGSYMLRATSNAAGSVDIVTVDAAPVTAGLEYSAEALLYSVGTSLTTHSEIRWYNAASALLATESRTETLPDGVSTRLKVVGTAPGGAVSAKLAFRPQATAAAQVVHLDEAGISVAPNPAGNLLTYDEYSTESALEPWSLTGGDALARSYLTSLITDGSYAVYFEPDGADLISLSLDRLVPVTPGVTYAATSAFFGRNTGEEITYLTYRARVDWYDTEGVLFSVSNPDQFYTRSVAPGFTSGATGTETRTCPDGAAFARITLEIDHSDSLLSAYYVDSVILREATPEYTLVTDDETGSVILTVNYVDDAAGYVTVSRMDADGSRSALRAFGSAYDLVPYSPGALVIEDYEAPLGSLVWYAVTWYLPDGTTRSVQLFTQRVRTPVLADPDHVWLKSPGIPALNTRVIMEEPPTWSRAARSARYDIVGRKNPVHVSGVRGGRSASLTVLVWDAADNALFDSLLDSGLPALVQAMPGYDIEGNLYLSIADVDVAHLSPDARTDGWRWTLAVTEIDRPAGGLQGSALSTWADIAETYDTWEDLFDAWPTWTQVLTGG